MASDPYGDPLKGCPFCRDDESPYLVDCTDDELSAMGGSEYVIVCSNCNARGPVAETAKGATQQWNDRA